MQFTWTQNEKIAVWALGCVTVGFIAYWFISQSAFLEKIFEKKYKPREKAIYWVVFQRFVGAIFLGILPMIAMSFGAKFFPNQYGDVLPVSNSTWWWIVGLSALVLPINYLNAKKPDNLAMYPQIRTKEWTLATFLWEYGTWVLYLYAYELLFRGILLFAIWQATQMAWLAIAVNVAIYAIAHIPKGQKEAIGAIPLGIVLAYLTLAEGNIWIAVIVHILLALSNSFFSFLAQPEFKFARKK
ncbi:CPBP family intramembrane glutamic endopeptidase [Raineya sp.]|jgi:membrane protease YdiL (CAAX protease family)